MLRVTGLRFLLLGPFAFEVAPGECVGLSGPSGSGKTHLLRAVADLDPHGGEVHLGDACAADLPAPVWRRRVGLLPPESGWWDEHVGPHLPEWARSGPRLERLGFARDVLGWEIARLSTGERRRLAIVRLLCNEPDALLLDEPTSGLDAANVAHAERLLREYIADRRAPAVWVSHDAAQLQRIAGRRLRLSDGRLEPAA